jgi:uncharacterized Tic20 family protein
MPNSPSPAITADDRNWAIYANAAGLLVFTNIPFVTLITTLVVWMKVRHDDARPFARAHAAAALRVQIMWTVLACAAILLTYKDLRGFLITYIALCVLNAIFSIRGCWLASDEKWV